MFGKDSIYKYYLLTLVVILIDQTIKVLVHTYMDLGTIGQIKIFGD